MIVWCVCIWIILSCEIWLMIATFLGFKWVCRKISIWHTDTAQIIAILIGILINEFMVPVPHFQTSPYKLQWEWSCEGAFPNGKEWKNMWKPSILFCFSQPSLIASRFEVSTRMRTVSDEPRTQDRRCMTFKRSMSGPGKCWEYATIFGRVSYVNMCQTAGNLVNTKISW